MVGSLANVNISGKPPKVWVVHFSGGKPMQHVPDVTFASIPMSVLLIICTASRKHRRAVRVDDTMQPLELTNDV
eukprot:CAMPEP_0195044972 /NCGR_PEP_ID=MMETSP0347-20130606/12256_1 /TAXON_ID=2932 /ORGANISM="Alexandrium fundyense, Strain CCMP1719" /LENGTH=73 /DNA_ID=CAMNT_0040072681 /DNA_START=12 /DNA_END=229 /DNA_ORIENTATION=-